MKLYPVFLNLADVPVFVVGGGKVASRKVSSLLKAQAKVSIISPEITPSIKRLVLKERIRWVSRIYQKGDIQKARVVVAATDDLDVNQQICRDARRLGLLVNCAAPPDAGNFQIPAVVRKSDIILAISTCGASPALAKQMRQELDTLLRDGYSDIVKQMRVIRKKIVKSSSTSAERKKLYRQMLSTLIADPRKHK